MRERGRRINPCFSGGDNNVFPSVIFVTKGFYQTGGAKNYLRIFMRVYDDRRQISANVEVEGLN